MKTIDEVVDSIPVGAYHYGSLAILVASYAMDSAIANSVGFITVCSGDGLGLSGKETGLLGSCLFFGEIFGSLFLAQYSDAVGRRGAILLALSLMAVFMYLSILSETYFLLVFFLVLTGFGVGGTSMNFSLITEIVPAEKRGSFSSLVQVGWGLGGVITIGLAWGIIGSGYNWRWLVFNIATLISLAIGLCYLYMPESIRWLYKTSQFDLAKKTAKDAATTSGAVMDDFSFSKQLIVENTNTEIGEGADSVIKANVDSQEQTLAEKASSWARELSDKTADIYDSENDMLSSILKMNYVFFSRIGVYFGISFLQTTYGGTTDTATDDATAVCTFEYAFMLYSCFLEIGAALLFYFFADKIGRQEGMTYLPLVTGVFLLSANFSGDAAAIYLIAISRALAFVYQVTTWISCPELFSTKYVNS